MGKIEGRMELTVQADTEKLNEVLAFVEEQLEKRGCPMRTMMQVQVAVEEIFVNIAHYAYQQENGAAVIGISFEEEPLQVIMTFLDQGIPYNPLEKEDPDITLPAEERQIGGLGIFMVKKTMDDVEYRYEDGKNILTVKKVL